MGNLHISYFSLEKLFKSAIHQILLKKLKWQSMRRKIFKWAKTYTKHGQQTSSRSHQVFLAWCHSLIFTSLWKLVTSSNTEESDWFWPLILNRKKWAFCSSVTFLSWLFGVKWHGSGEQSSSSRGRHEKADSKMTFRNALFVPFAHLFHHRQLVSSAGIFFVVISTHYTLGQSEE